ncbi:MAG: DMP19 family protein [Clostridiales bacterium]|nr:DMP19 family protein [Clostridiales bacterium]
MRRICNIAGYCFGLAMVLVIVIGFTVTYLKSKKGEYFHMNKQEFLEIAEGGDDDELLEEAFEWSENFCPINGKNLSKAPAPVRYTQAMLHLDSEVLNGGFAQFYYNGYHTYGFEYETAFRAAELDEVADIYLRAQACFEKIKHTMPSGKSLEEFSKWCTDNPLDEFDEEYYEQQEEISEAIAEYIRSNISVFGD